jgi:hypothetical protein
MIEHALNKEWRKRELSKGERSFHSIKLFIPSNDILNLSIHTFPMVMRTEKAISMFNSKVSKLRVYFLNKTRLFMWWRNLTHSQLLKGLKYESQTEDIRRIKSWGTLPGLQHYRGACWRSRMELGRINKL